MSEVEEELSAISRDLEFFGAMENNSGHVNCTKTHMARVRIVVPTTEEKWVSYSAE